MLTVARISRILYYSLSFSSQVSHTGRNAFSLDGAKTKFPSLEHLVDFHKMNSGALPTILQDCALDTRLGAERTGGDDCHSHCSPCFRPDTAHCGQELERASSS